MNTLLLSFANIAMILALAQFNTSTVTNPLNIAFDSSSTDIEINRELSISVNVTNIGSEKINDFDLSLISPGFSIVQATNFPESVSPYSKLQGFYTLKANTPGKTMAWISATFSQNLSESNFMQRQSSYVTEPIYFNIIESSNLQFSQIWIGSITTILGAILGIIIPIFYRRLNRSREARSERKAAIEKAKSLLEYELDYNHRLVSNYQTCSTEKWGEVIKDYYYLISENPKLSDALLNLYSKLDDYNSIKNPLVRKNRLNKDEYIKLIDQTNSLVKSWKYTEK